ncbi:hypothetical protein D0864_00250 [Hortaea werneckii]|uniref:Uncharacterized protein n=1 Tax=Hortaea werneckii TaxID=91943 RepID=A0A3M7HLW2_HORWE|nr:hypothetical protein D0864_00250 [Hortaea werneckii]
MSSHDYVWDSKDKKCKKKKENKSKNVASPINLPKLISPTTHVIQRRHSMACSSLPDCSAEEFRSSLEPLQQIARYRSEWTTTTEFELGTHHRIAKEMVEK